MSKLSKSKAVNMLMNSGYYEQGYVQGYKQGILDVLDKIKAEIEEEYGGCYICEWDEDYDWDENDISDYLQVGTIKDLLEIIDKYRNFCYNKGEDKEEKGEDEQ